MFAYADLRRDVRPATGHKPEAVAMTSIDTLFARLQFEAPTFPRSPYSPIAHTPGGTPIYPAQGGRGGGGIEFAVGDDDGPDPEFDDEDDADEDDDEPDDEDDAPARGRARRGQEALDDADDPEWEPPTREAWERATAALKRANSEAGRRRRVGKMMDKLGIDDLGTWLTSRGIDPETGEPYGTDVVGTEEGDGYDPADEYGYEREDDTRRRPAADDRQTVRQIRAAEMRARAAERDQLMPIMAEQAARLALRDAGFVGNQKQLERALRSIDPDSLDLDMDGSSFELIGIEEAIAELQDDLPELFDSRSSTSTRRMGTRATPRKAAPSRTRGGAREVDGGERGRQPAKSKTWAEQIAEQMARGRGR